MAKTDFGLAFADGVRWTIRALDDEAEATVRNLGKVLRLGPARGGGRLCSVSGRQPARSRQRSGGRGVSCWLGPGRGQQVEAFRMDRVTTAIAERSIAWGGLLLHGALAVRDGSGFVLAGPSGVGKSTACQRLPAPWEPLSDDCTFAVRDPDGVYWAHPWPTWSLLRDKGLVASWPLEQAVPLKALLFLRQSTSDRAERVTATPAAALIMESAHLLPRIVMFVPDADAGRAVCLKYLRAARALAAAVPAFRLSVSPAGRFWKEIERAVGTGPRMDRDEHSGGARTEQNVEPRKETTSTDCADEHGLDARNRTVTERRVTAAKTRAVRPGPRKSKKRTAPEPPQHLLSGSPKPRLVSFQVGPRAFMKLVAGRRLVASANDLVRDWRIQRQSRSQVRKQTVPYPKSQGARPKSEVRSPRRR